MHGKACFQVKELQGLINARPSRPGTVGRIIEMIRGGGPQESMLLRESGHRSLD